MTDFEVWLYRIVIAGMSIIVWFAIQRLIKKFDELIHSINELSENYKVQASQIIGILNQLKDFTGRLNDHGKRLRNIEINNAKGNNKQDNETN